MLTYTPDRRGGQVNWADEHTPEGADTLPPQTGDGRFAASQDGFADNDYPPRFYDNDTVDDIMFHMKDYGMDRKMVQFWLTRTPEWREIQMHQAEF